HATSVGVLASSISTTTVTPISSWLPAASILRSSASYRNMRTRHPGQFFAIWATEHSKNLASKEDPRSDRHTAAVVVPLETSTMTQTWILLSSMYTKR